MAKQTQYECEVKVLTQVAACTDKASSRYALAYVQAQRINDHEVCLIATDGRCAALVRAEGRVPNEGALIPSKVLPTTQAAVKRGYSVRRSGHWFGDNERFTDVPDENQRFPSVVDVVNPMMTDHVAVTINPDLLLKLKKALNTESDSLTLFVKDTESAVNVLGENGVGCLMPVSSGEGNEKPPQARQRLIAKFGDLLSSLIPQRPVKRLEKN